MEQKQKSSKEKLTRTCAGCNQKQNKYTLIRIVKSPDGTVSIDPSGKANGRGAYLCRNLTCLQQAKKTKRLNRVLKTEVPTEIYDQLEELIES